MVVGEAGGIGPTVQAANVKVLNVVVPFLLMMPEDLELLPHGPHFVVSQVAKEDVMMVFV